VAPIFNIPLLATNWIAIHKIPFLPSDLILLKKFKYKDRNVLISFEELLGLDYGENLYYSLQRKNIEVVDNTPEELLSATSEMLERLNAKHERPAVKPASMASKFRGMLEKLLPRDDEGAARFGGHPVVSEARFARTAYLD
jgi:putative glycosyltransferase (TIGR04372 family)